MPTLLPINVASIDVNATDSNMYADIVAHMLPRVMQQKQQMPIVDTNVSVNEDMMPT